MHVGWSSDAVGWVTEGECSMLKNPGPCKGPAFAVQPAWSNSEELNKIWEVPVAAAAAAVAAAAVAAAAAAAAAAVIKNLGRKLHFVVLASHFWILILLQRHFVFCFPVLYSLCRRANDNGRADCWCRCWKMQMIIWELALGTGSLLLAEQTSRILT